jgi:hypothetical protein
MTTATCNAGWLFLCERKRPFASAVPERRYSGSGPSNSRWSFAASIQVSPFVQSRSGSVPWVTEMHRPLNANYLAREDQRLFPYLHYTVLISVSIYIFDEEVNRFWLSDTP